MKQTLLKTMALGLLMMVGVNAWADRDTSKNFYCPQTDGSYETLYGAIDSIKSNTATTLEVQIWGTRPKLGKKTGDGYSSKTSFRIEAVSGKTINIVPKVSGIILTAGDHARSNIWFLNAQDNATLSIGSSEYAMTIEGYGLNSNNAQLNGVCVNEKKGLMNITNVTFQKFLLNSETKNGSTTYGYLYTNKVASVSDTEGYATLTDVTITNCQTELEAFIKSINTNNDAICLVNSFNVTHNTGRTETVFNIAGRIRLGAKTGNSSVSITTNENISITWASTTTTIGTAAIVKAKKEMASKFELTNNDLGLFGNDTDLKLTQAYTLAVTDAGAATLVLPFALTIPTGASCFKLKHTDGSATVQATAVETTLSANTPVLVEASKGSYKFVSTATEGTVATGSEDQTPEGQSLTGVFTDKTFGTGITSFDNIYILNKVGDTVGFYKAASGKKVGANRCYLTATNVPNAARSLNIVFGDDETTGNYSGHLMYVNNV